MSDSADEKKPDTSKSTSGTGAGILEHLSAAPFLVLLILFLTVLSYSATPRFGFVFDDKIVVVQNPFIRSWNLVPRFFTSSVLIFDPTGAALNYYRPVFLLWLRLNYVLFSLKPAGWHLTTLGLHLLITWMVYRLALRMTSDSSTALFATAIFGLHPAHLESVAWISGTTDLLAAAPTLASLLVFLGSPDQKRTRARWILALAWYSIGILAKENALVLPMLLLVYVWLWESERGDSSSPLLGRVWACLKAVAPFLAVTAAYLAVRFAIVKGMAHPMAEVSVRMMLLTIPSVLWGYLRLLVWPYPLSIYYDTWYVQKVRDLNFIAPLVGVGGVALLLGIWCLRGKDSKVVTFACAWLILPLLPVLDLRLFPAGEIVHDRYLYFSSVGFALLVSLAWRLFIPESPYFKRPRLLKLASAAILTILLACGTGFQSVYWANELLLYTRAVAVAPNKAIAKGNLAVVAWDQGMKDAAIRLYRESLRERPSIWLTWYNLGYSYYELGRYQEAEMCLTQALELNDTNPDTYFVLGLTHSRLGKGDAADLIRRAIQLRPYGLRYHFSLGVLYKSQGKYAQSLEEFRKELAIDPDEQEARRQIEELSSKAGP